MATLINIKEGDRFIQVNSKTRVVARVQLTGKIEPVFNIYTEGEHNFIADSCIAHNFTEFRNLRTILHKVFLDLVSKVLESQYA